MGKVRKLKVYGMGSYKGKDVATIVLKGKWLQELGFEIGIPIQVECEEGRLVLVRKDGKE